MTPKRLLFLDYSLRGRTSDRIYDAQAFRSSGFVVGDFKNIINTLEKLLGITVIDSANNIIRRFVKKGKSLKLEHANDMGIKVLDSKSSLNPSMQVGKN